MNTLIYRELTMHTAFKSLLILCFAFMACAVQAAQKNTRTMEQILASGELRVGVSLFTPWTMRAKNGDLIGSEVDMANRLAKDMGVKAQLSVYEWEQIMSALAGGEIDVIIAGMAVTPSRALQFNFSNPYATSGIGLVTNSKLTASIKKLEDMQNKKVNVGAVAGTESERVAKRVFAKATLKSFTDEKSAIEALVSDQLHAYVELNPVPKFTALRHPEKVDVPLKQPLHSIREAIAVRKGDADFVNFLNAWIVAREADAWLTSNRHYWFETLNWREQIQ